MNAFRDIIAIMSDDDKSAFKLYLSKRNKRQDAGNVVLFKLLETDDINIHKNKNKQEADAHHAMRKRLYDNLVEFMANRSFSRDTSEEQHVLRFLVVSRVFLEHKLTRTAFKVLAKAEAIAVGLEHFSLLNEIYHTQIQFAHLDTKTDLGVLIKKFEGNRKRMLMEERLNVGYALLRRELTEMQHRGKVLDFQRLIRNTIAGYGISLREALTFKSLYQILFIANEYASVNSDYSLIQPFVARSYAFVSKREGQAERHLYYHIYILYLMANFQFRSGNFAQSLLHLDTMLLQMEKQKKRYYNRFCMRYFLLKALNENYSGNPGQAEHTAVKALSAHPKAEANDINDLRLALIVFHLQQDAGRDAAKQMAKFSHSDSWYEKKMGVEWIIKKSLVEILLHIQQENTELALSRIKSFRRRYKAYLAEVSEQRVLDYLVLVERYALKPEIIGTEKFREAAIHFAEQAKSGAKDIIVLSFLAWLIAKVNRRNIYDTTLSLLGDYFLPSHSA